MEIADAVDNIGITLHNRLIAIALQAAEVGGRRRPRPSAIRVTAGGRTEKCALAKQTQSARRRASVAARCAGHRPDRWRRIGETKPTRAGTRKTVSAASEPEPLRRIRVLAKRSHRVPNRPHGALAATRALGQIYKTQNEFICESLMKSTTMEPSNYRSVVTDAVLAKQSHRFAQSGRPPALPPKKAGGTPALRACRVFAKQSHRAGPRHGSVPPPRPG